MSLESKIVYPDGREKKLDIYKPGNLGFITETVSTREAKIVAIYLPYTDYGAEVHELDPEEVDLDELWEEGVVPDDLLSEDTQVGYVFANTVYKHPTTLPEECGRIVLTHKFGPGHLN